MAYVSQIEIICDDYLFNYSFERTGTRIRGVVRGVIWSNLLTLTDIHAYIFIEQYVSVLY